MTTRSVAPRALRAPGVRPVALGLLSAVAGVAVLAVSGWLVVRAAERPPVLALLTTIVLVRALGMIRALGRYAERLASHDLALTDLADERRRWYARLAGRVGAPGAPGAADLLTRFTVDVDELQHRRPRVVLPVLVAVGTGLPAVLAAALVLPGAAAVLAAGLVVAVVAAPAWTWLVARPALGRQGAARSAFAARLDGALRDGPQLAVAGLGPATTRRLDDDSRALGRIDRRIAWAAALGQAATVAVGGATLVLVLVLGARATAAGDLSPVLLGALVLLTIGVLELTGPLPEAAMRWLGVDRARRRLDAGVAGPATLTEPAGPRPLPPTAALVADGLVHRPGGPGTPVVLDGVDLRVEPGERIAIVGPSGAGKSTLAALLVRLADPDDGDVRLGDVPLRDATTADVRARIRLAGQDAHLVATSLGANVRIGAPDADDAAVVAALRTAGLGAWFDALPDGLATLLGEDGLAVSGGQRQRIGLARALASPAGILVLDEPTAMLDAATAAAVVRDVLAATPGRTVVITTHDSATLDAFDRVLELRAGSLSPASWRSSEPARRPVPAVRPAPTAPRAAPGSP
ncbi:thiol reductant ABC exporter subunit CydC [Patulibacter minatonensis]|uniref:thiol reductant ABC exporter subunit CydC n=1 Tax=Patulibacter minatonensis TaxID=298163 RepID=UPI0004B2BB96|nr:thiol reductant ABC exporter subunit CydC [Patulibacter minatonensis]